MLTFDAYQRLGGLDGALARRAEEVFAGLEKTAQDTLPAVLRALVTVGTEEEKPVAARRVPLEALASTLERKKLIDAFVEARLLVTDRADDGTSVIRLAHEALIDHWPRVQNWLDQDREFLRARAWVAIDAARWREETHDPDFLIPEGKPLAEAEHILMPRRSELDAALAEYVEASIKAFHRRLENRHSEARRRFRIAVVAALIFGLLAISAAATGYLAFEHKIEAERQKEIADMAAGEAATERDNALRTQSLFLADLSRQQTTDGYAVNGILLGLEALPNDMVNPNRPYEARAEDALFEAVLAHRELAVLSGHEHVVSHAEFSPDGDRIVTASLDKTARIWDATRGVQIAVLTGHTDRVTHAEFSPVGTRIVTASYDRTVRLWDATIGVELYVLRGHDGRVWRASFSSDDRRIVTASSDRTARVWGAGCDER